MRVVAVGSVLLVLLVLVGGYVRGQAQPLPPTIRFEPTIIGQIARAEERLGYDGRYFLDTGDVLDLNADGVGALPVTPRLSTMQLVDVDRADRANQLLLAGHDTTGRTWYAVARLQPNDRCPFTISAGEAFDAADRLVFSTGLSLRKAPDFEVGPAWLLELGTREPFPLGPADVICINRQGWVVRADLAYDY